MSAYEFIYGLAYQYVQRTPQEQFIASQAGKRMTEAFFLCRESIARRRREAALARQSEGDASAILASSSILTRPLQI